MIRFVRTFGIALACAATLPLFHASAADKSGLSPEQQAEVRKLIRETLLKNPEIIMEAVQELRRRQETAKAEAQEKALAARRSELLANPDDPVGGNPKGSVTVVEFFDYNCGYCRRAKTQVDALLSEDKDIRVVYKEFPILGPGSEVAARAALASREQGKYQKFHDAMLTFGGRLEEPQIMSIAKAVGLDVDKLKEDMKSEAITEEIKKNHELAKALNITGTPAFVIGSRMIPGAISKAEMQRHVARARRDCAEAETKVC